MCINIIQREALCQRGLSQASSSPVHFFLLVKFRGKLDGAAKLDVFPPPTAERSADQAHSRGKLCKSLPLIWYRTSWPQEYISRLEALPFWDPHITSAVPSPHSLASGSNMCGSLEKGSSVCLLPAGNLACFGWRHAECLCACVDAVSYKCTFIFHKIYLFYFIFNAYV